MAEDSYLKLACYNSRGLPKSQNDTFLRPDLISVFSNHDIVCLQETWYAKQELHLANTLFPDFTATGVAKTDFSQGLIRGRASGGAIVFYRKCFANSITPILFDQCDWCVGIDVKMGNNRFIILNVYKILEIF